MANTISLLPEATDLRGKTAIVTGCNKGLGFEVARQLILLKCSRLIITTRNETKGKATIAALRADPEVTKIDFIYRTPTHIECFELELGDYESGVAFVRKVQMKVPELDILILSAGVYRKEFEKTRSGHEMMMQVNCYANCLILLNLVSLLRVTSRRRGSPSRVTVVSSYSYNLHTRNANPVFGDQDIIEYFDAEKNFGRYHRYFDSKLMMHGFVQQLADIVPQNEMVVNSVCPGVIATDLFLGVPTWVKPIMWVLRQVKGRTLEEGGRVIVHAATTAGKETHGELIRNGRIESNAPFLMGSIGQAYMTEFWYAICNEVMQVYSDSLAADKPPQQLFRGRFSSVGH